MPSCCAPRVPVMLIASGDLRVMIFETSILVLLSLLQSPVSHNWCHPLPRHSGAPGRGTVLQPGARTSRVQPTF